MAYWNFYFAIKLYLVWIGALQPVWALNLVLALVLLPPLRGPVLPLVRQGVAVAIAVGLLSLEVNVASMAAAFGRLGEIWGFSGAYLLELAGRTALPFLVVVGVLVLLVYVANRFLGQLATLGFLVVAASLVWNQSEHKVLPGGGGGARQAAMPSQDRAGTNRVSPAVSGVAVALPADAYEDQWLTFRADEAERRVRFSPMAADPEAQFDVIILHVCSLSWDDLDVANARNHPFLSRFDYVFENFNSATSYSNPTAIRLLRASCGQQPHEALFRPTAAGCYLFAQLANAGYEPQAVFNHDGRYGNFSELISREMGIRGVNVAVPNNLPTAMVGFDGSKVAGDGVVLKTWYDAHVARKGPPVALYYNSVSMHDGNRLLDGSLSSLQSYPRRLNTLFNDVDDLIATIERSGRRAVVVFVPEHGAALRGGVTQIAGMRETPTPQLVNVPVGVKLVGLPHKTQASGKPIVIAEPTSHLALAQLLANLVGDSPFGASAPDLSVYAASLPSTRLVAENENTITMATENGYVVRTADGKWVPGR